jgi:hypothetical protein
MKDRKQWCQWTENGARLSLDLYLYLPFLILLLLTGCATTYPVNPPLTHIDQDTAYNYHNVAGESDKSNNVLGIISSDCRPLLS